MFDDFDELKMKRVTLALGALVALKVVLLGYTLSVFGNIGLSANMVSYPLLLLEGLIAPALVSGAILGLVRGRPWGPYASAVIALFHLPTLCFPISLYIGWNLLPERWRGEISSEATALFASRKSSEDSAAVRNPPAS